MVMTHEDATAMITAAQNVISNGGEVPREMRCQYPSKRCNNIRTTKRGGGLHRLCSFHRTRANKNQWLVDQRRRLRREREGSLLRRGSSANSECTFTSMLETELMLSIDVLDADTRCPPLANEDLEILQSLLHIDQNDGLSDLCDFNDLSDESLLDGTLEWTI